MAKPEASKPEKNQPAKKPARQPLNTYAKYTYLGFQMAAFVAAGAGIGYWLDEKNQNDTPWYTVILSLVGVFAGMYVVLRDFLKKD